MSLLSKLERMLEGEKKRKHHGKKKRKSTRRPRRTKKGRFAKR